MEAEKPKRAPPQRKKRSGLSLNRRSRSKEQGYRSPFWKALHDKRDATKAQRAAEALDLSHSTKAELQELCKAMNKTIRKQVYIHTHINIYSIYNIYI
jgi:hypothetical protein